MAGTKSNLLKFEVTNRFTGAVQFTAEIECSENESYSIKLGLAVKWGIKSDANLTRAYLAGANLADANLAGATLADAYLADANLTRAYLAGANLADANLAGATLADAYLADANLADANLAGANLADAYLADANLADANLAGATLADAYLAGANLADATLADATLTRAYLADANLTRAYLAGANLADANLTRAYLAGATLTRAYLADAKDAALAIAKTRILPDGDLIGWKKCKDNVLVKLRIPAGAKRSHAFGRKCRAEFVDVLEVIGADVGLSQYDGKTQYIAGQRVIPDSYDDNWQKECSSGIHFFITPEEAEEY